MKITENLLKRLTIKKERLVRLQPFKKEILKNLEDWLKVELTYSSNAIEGNTLSRIETAEIIEKGISAVISGKAFKDQLEAVNHAKAIEFLKIGELAKETNETIHTLRFWTKAGLLEVAKYTESGYQLYSPTMIKRVKEIRLLQKEDRLHIEEIRKRLRS